MPKKKETEKKVVAPKGKIVFINTGKTATPDDVVRGILGISAQQFIREIKENRGGKYDSLYI